MEPIYPPKTLWILHSEPATSNLYSADPSLAIDSTRPTKLNFPIGKIKPFENSCPIRVRVLQQSPPLTSQKGLIHRSEVFETHTSVRFCPCHFVPATPLDPPSLSIPFPPEIGNIGIKFITQTLGQQETRHRITQPM